MSGRHDAEAGMLLHVTRPAMACDFELRFPAAGGEAFLPLALETLETLDTLERQLSVFRPEGQLSRINLRAAEEPVPVESELFELLQFALHLSRETGGAIDVTSAPLWELWGFAKRAGGIPTKQQIAEALGRVGSQYVRLDPAEKSVRFTRPGVKLNLGGIGKGYAMDRLAEQLRQGGLHHFVLHGGQSSILARGEGPGSSEGDSPIFPDHADQRRPSVDGARSVPVVPEKLGQSPEPSWIVGLPSPRSPTRRIAEIRLKNKALGTSSSQFQSFRHEGKRYGHILDPRTGRPAAGVLSATAVAPTATLADALSTAFYVLGPEASQQYCRKHPGIGAILLLPPKDTGAVEILTAGLTEEEFQPLE